jgi:hypothetical protein
MNRFKEYITTLLRTFNPLSYRHFSESVKRHAFGFFLTTIFIATIITSILCVPKYFAVEDHVSTIFSKLESMNTKINVETTEPIFLPEKADLKPGEKHVFILDTRGVSSPNASEIYVDGTFVYYNQGKNRKTLDEISDAKEHQDVIKQFVKVALIVIAPALFIFGFIAHVLGFLLIITILAGFVSIVSTQFRHKITFSEGLNIGLFASVFLAFAMITKAIYPEGKIYFIAIFLIYFILGIIFSMKDDHDRLARKLRGNEKKGDNK